MSLRKQNPHVTKVSKVGRLIMAAVPPAAAEALDLQPGTEVGLTIRFGKLVLEPQSRPRYSLDELLAQCNSTAPRSGQERQWFIDKRAGRELV